jgi:hypothetical protein
MIKMMARDMLRRFKEFGETEQHNFACCSIFAREMSKKLNAARKKGRGGWWDKEQCSIDDLMAGMQHHIEKGDMRDVANFAMMIYWRRLFDITKEANNG